MTSSQAAASMKEAENHYRNRKYNEALMIYENLIEYESSHVNDRNHPEYTVHANNMRLLKMRIDDCRDKLSPKSKSKSNIKEKSSTDGLRGFIWGFTIAILLICIFAFVANTVTVPMSDNIGESITDAFRWFPEIGESIVKNFANHNVDLMGSIHQYVGWSDTVIYCTIAILAVLIAILLVHAIAHKILKIFDKHANKKLSWTVT